jgi:hypothetical protein
MQTGEDKEIIVKQTKYKKMKTSKTTARKTKM